MTRISSMIIHGLQTKKVLELNFNDYTLFVYNFSVFPCHPNLV